MENINEELENEVEYKGVASRKQALRGQCAVRPAGGLCF